MGNNDQDDLGEEHRLVTTLPRQTIDDSVAALTCPTRTFPAAAPTTSSTTTTANPGAANIVRPAVELVGRRYQDSGIRKLENVSADNIDYVETTLHRTFPRTGKERLVFKINRYVPKDIGPLKDRYEFIAKVIVELQKQPGFGLPVPGFPSSISDAYVAEVEDFILFGGGRDWIEHLLEPAALSPSSNASPTPNPMPTVSNNRPHGATPEMSEVTDNAASYFPGSRAQHLGQILPRGSRVTPPISLRRSSSFDAVIDIDRRGRVVDNLRIHRTLSDRYGTFTIIGLQRGGMTTRLPLVLWISVSFIVVLFWYVFS